MIPRMNRQMLSKKYANCLHKSIQNGQHCDFIVGTDWTWLDYIKVSLLKKFQYFSFLKIIH